MSAAANQSSLGQARGAGQSFGPDSGKSSDTATPAMSVGSATAAGHGDRTYNALLPSPLTARTRTRYCSNYLRRAANNLIDPKDNADDSNATLPNTRVGPQNEDLNGEQMRAPGEGEVFQAQLDKKNAGWGEQDSMTGDLDRMKAEQKGAREEVKEERKQGANVDGGAGNRTENEGLSAV